MKQKTSTDSLIFEFQSSKRTKDLAKVISPRCVAVIAHDDLDRVAAESLVAAKVAAVINTRPSITGRYPNGGPNVLLKAKIPLIDIPTEIDDLQDYDYVGKVKSINASIIERMYKEDLIPIISTIGISEDGQSLNINADDAAAALAVELHAEKLIIMSNIPGLLKDVTDENSVISELEYDDAKRMINNGEISQGMIPKLGSCVDAVGSGVKRAHIIDGRKPHSVLMELFTNEGIGTMFYKD